jgi:ubiquinone/menaquinone biosynthesis C-methylase UbiE
LKPESLLEIGVGDKVIASYIKNNTDMRYVSADYSAKLNPDVVADVRKLPFIDNQFDLVCAFEVLEHLPFEDFEHSVRELLRVAKKNVIISMPHWGRSFAFSIQLPFIGIKKFNFKLPYALFKIKHKFNGEHHWEIGKDAYPVSRIKKAIAQAGGKLQRDFVPTENTYHHFFVINK